MNRLALGEGETELQIRKAPVERLLYLLGYARDPHGWRDDEIQLAGVEELVPAMAVSFAALAHRALQQGVLQGHQKRRKDCCSAGAFGRGSSGTPDCSAR